MKLVIVGSYPLDADRIESGVDAAIVYLIEGLKQISDLDIQVITCRKEIKREKIIKKENITIHYLPSQKHFVNITLGLIEKYRIRKKIGELKPDIIHSQNQTSYSYAALETKYPTVITVHGILYKEVKLRKGIRNWVRRYPITYMEKVCLKKATDIIFVSPYVKEMVKHLTKARVYSVEYPISNKYFQIENNEVPDKILFAGNIIKRKNLLDLLKAVNILRREISRIELRIAGGIGEPYYFEILKNYIKENNIENNITFLGHLSEDKIMEEYGKCCLLVLTSFQDTAPLVILQAMAAGKAVVAARIGGIPYLIEDSRTGFLVDCGDVKSLAEKIKLLLNNKDLRKKFGENAKQDATKRFKAEIIAKKTYEVYQEILKRERG